VLAGFGLKLHVDNQRDLFELEIARAWLDQWLTPAPLPQIQDASTGDLLLLVTDHAYRCGGARYSLPCSPDVSGDSRQDGVE
jgi:hypothetical protein